ncbi:hypothetical protein [Streptomyces europaeiscabiei]|uniref:hypothetical protein n=1 Tax=Streptomyces europaeiscabiei TaxID=146819 RepID=UPI0029B69D0B|nr:hypothetical protein [Streptomyces europaeiscabiei]MDX3581994.1 hypothetical protein [Streptomyces europaeiscabiei]
MTDPGSAAVDRTFRDAVALVTGLLELDREPELDALLADILGDLEDNQHIAPAAFGVIVTDLLGELATYTGQTRQDLWQAAASRINRSEN